MACTYPTSALLDVGEEGFGDGAVLESLVNEASLPAGTQHGCGAADILRKGLDRETVDALKCLAASDVATSKTVGVSQSVVDNFGDSGEVGHGLGQWVVDGQVVESLRRADKSHLGLFDKMRQHGAEPLRFGNHVSVETGDIFGDRRAGAVVASVVVVDALHRALHGGAAGHFANLVHGLGLFVEEAVFGGVHHVMHGKFPAEPVSESW